MFTMIGNKSFEVKETNGKFFYYSKAANRWMPVKKSKVQYEEVFIDPMDDFNYVGSKHHY